MPNAAIENVDFQGINASIHRLETLTHLPQRQNDAFVIKNFLQVGKPPLIEGESLKIISTGNIGQAHSYGRAVDRTARQRFLDNLHRAIADN